MQHCKDMFCEELFEFYLDVQETRALYLESVEKKVSCASGDGARMCSGRGGRVRWVRLGLGVVGWGWV